MNKRNLTIGVALVLTVILSYLMFGQKASGAEVVIAPQAPKMELARYDWIFTNPDSTENLFIRMSKASDLDSAYSDAVNDLQELVIEGKVRPNFKGLLWVRWKGQVTSRFVRTGDRIRNGSCQMAVMGDQTSSGGNTDVNVKIDNSATGGKADSNSTSNSKSDSKATSESNSKADAKNTNTNISQNVNNNKNENNNDNRNTNTNSNKNDNNNTNNNSNRNDNNNTNSNANTNDNKLNNTNNNAQNNQDGGGKNCKPNKCGNDHDSNGDKHSHNHNGHGDDNNHGHND